MIAQQPGACLACVAAVGTDVCCNLLLLCVAGQSPHLCEEDSVGELLNTTAKQQHMEHSHLHRKAAGEPASRRIIGEAGQVRT